MLLGELKLKNKGFEQITLWDLFRKCKFNLVLDKKV